MLQKIKPAAWMAATFICFTCITGIAWQNNPVTAGRHRQDTLPKQQKAEEGETIVDGDLDKAIEQVEKATENLEKQFQHKDWEKMQKDLLKAQTALNTQNIQEQVAKAMKEIDWEKIQLQTQSALKQIDWEKMQKDLQKTEVELRATIDSRKMEADIQRSMEEAKKAMLEMKTIDMEKIQAELDKSQETLKIGQQRMQEDLENARKELNENLYRNLRKELEKAKAGAERAGEELQNYKKMLNEMERDGLLHAGEPYDIEYKKPDLFINGKQQSGEVTSKYGHYFKKDKVTIKKDMEEDNKTIHL